MKAEINNETKAKFFALYWGQEIGLWNKIIHAKIVNEIRKVNHSFIAVNPNYCPQIILKPLSQISDEDAIEVAKLATHRHEKSSWKLHKIENGKVYFIDDWMVGQYWKSKFFVKVNSFPLSGPFELVDGEIISQQHFQFALDAYDFLRSKGYALPWMGLNVEEMVEAGWIKLNDN